MVDLGNLKDYEFDITEEEEAFSNDIQYDGFNIEYTLNIMNEKGLGRNIARDFNHFAILIAQRGTKILKSINKMSDMGRMKVDELRLIYEVTDQRPETKEDVTLGRISCLIPHLIASAIKEGHGRVVGNPGNLPLCLCFPAGVSLIPREGEGSDLYDDYVSWSLSFNRVIGSSDNAQYIDIAYNSNLFSDDERRSWLEKLDVI
jgi:hypothetical protein